MEFQEPDDAAQDPRFSQIKRQKVSDRVAQEIMRMIAAGRLAPGECLPGERQIARMMQVSRVSVRAALQQLKAQGLLHAIQGGATRVSASMEEVDSALSHLVRADAANLYDLAEIRASLEVWAARRAALNATPQHLAEIEAAFARMCDPERAEAHKAEDDTAFHLAVAKAAGSAVYLHLVSALAELMERSVDFHRNSLVAGAQGDALVLRHHRRILDALKARDPAAAGAAMAEHLGAMLDSYRSVASQDRTRPQPRIAPLHDLPTAEQVPMGEQAGDISHRSRGAEEEEPPRAEPLQNRPATRLCARQLSSGTAG